MENLNIVAALVVLSKLVIKFTPVFVYNKWHLGIFPRSYTPPSATEVTEWMQLHLPYTMRFSSLLLKLVDSLNLLGVRSSSNINLMVLCKHSLICHARTHHWGQVLSVRSLFVLNILYVCTSRRKMIAFAGSEFHIITMFVTLITNGISYMMCRYFDIQRTVHRDIFL
jgi:hypothetical protein